MDARERRTSCWRLPAIAGFGLWLLAAPLAAGIAAAQTVTSIAVEGNRRIDAEAIRGYFGPRDGAPLDAARIDAGLKALYASGLFKDVRIARQADRLTVTVAEAPVIDRVRFEGNRSLKDKQLTDETQSKPRGTLVAATVQADVARLTDIYKRSGRFDARVEPKTIARAGDCVDLVFEIAEGAKTTIRRIDFTGNHAYAASRLKGVIKSGETGLLSFLTSSDLYDPDRVEADRDLLRRFYLNHGYADARIVSARAELDPAAKGIVVAFAIEEGERYRFGDIVMQSRVAEIDGRAFADGVKPRTGDVYDAGAVETAADDLTIALARHGHPFATARPRPERNAQAKTVDVVFTIEQAPPTYVERINIRGNTRTRDYVVRREFELAEGDAFNRALAERAERRLKALDYFKTVKITTEPGSAPDRVVVNVDVSEEQTGEFTFGVGYSTADGLIGNVGVSERNFLGRGQFVKLSLAYGQYSKAFDAGAVEPYFLGSGLSLGVNVFAKETTASSYQSYGSDSYGAGLRLAAPLTEETSVALRYSITNQNVTLAPGATAVSLPIQQAALAGPSWLSMIGTTLAYDTRDNKKNPTSGMRAEFSEDVAGLGGDVHFLKTTEDVRAYREIASEVVVMGRLQSGYLAPWGGQDVPLINRFFGGPQLVRGFAPYGFGPRDLTPGSTMDNLGGTAFWGTTAEVQSAIPYLPSDLGLKVAMFADAGSVRVTGGQVPALSQSFTLGNSSVIRSSVGVGLIWGSPFGPIRVDYAVPTSKASYDLTQRLGFSAGGF